MSDGFWIHFSKKATATIDKNAEREAKSRREVVAEAVGLYNGLHEEAWKGAKLVLEYPNGKREEIIFTSIPKLEVDESTSLLARILGDDKLTLIMLILSFWTASVLGLARLLEDREDQAVGVNYLVWVSIGMIAALFLGSRMVEAIVRRRDQNKAKLAASEQ